MNKAIPEGFLSPKTSEADLMAAMVGEAPKEQAAEPKPGKRRTVQLDAPDQSAQADRPAAKSSPGAARQGGDNEGEEPTILDSLVEDGEPEDDDDDEGADRDDRDGGAADDDEGGDGAAGDEGEDDDPLDGIFDDADDDGDGDGQQRATLKDDDEVEIDLGGDKKAKATFGELKQLYAAREHITQQTREIQTIRQAAEADYGKGQETVMALLQTMGQAIFRRTIPQPSEDLKRTDPNRYNAQMLAYQNEGAAIQQQQQTIEQGIMAMEGARADRIKAERQAAAAELRRIMPVFSDPVKGPKVSAAIVTAAKEIGWTEEQIAACTDPLIFKAVALAARELRRSKSPTVKKAAEKTRTLAARGSQNRDVRLDAKSREKKAHAAAQKNPTTDNLMATMLTQPKTRRRR